MIAVVPEGDLDYAVAERLIRNAGGTCYPAAVPRGRERILANMRGYAEASKHGRWLILCDLEKDDCAPGLIARHLGESRGALQWRVAVRKIESWLLGDEELAKALAVSPARLPRNPDLVADPKVELVNIARRSRSRKVRNDLATETGRVGPGYNRWLTEFVRDHWDPRRAAERSDSLRRAIAAVERLVAG